MSFHRMNRETDEIQEILDNFRELVHGYNENMRYHHRTLDSYQQNINQSIGLLHFILNRIINNSRAYQTDTREPRTTNNHFRDNRSTRNGNGNNNNSLETDITSLIYMFMTPPQNMNGARNTDIRYLTSIQIDNAIEMITYNSETIEVRHCPITLDDFVENEEICRIRGCGHIFRRQPLLQWLETHVGCPVCRFDLRDFSNNIINENRQQSNNNMNSVGIQRTTTISDFDNVRANNTPTSSSALSSPRFINENEINNRQRSNSMISNRYSLHIPLENENRNDDENIQNISQIIVNVLRNQFDISNNFLHI